MDAFWWLEMNRVGDYRDTKLNSFLHKIKEKSFQLYQTNYIKESVKICCVAVLKGTQQRKEELD